MQVLYKDEEGFLAVMEVTKAETLMTTILMMMMTKTMRMTCLIA